jgi:hypothetical protein
LRAVPDIFSEYVVYTFDIFAGDSLCDDARTKIVKPRGGTSGNADAAFVASVKKVVITDIVLHLEEETFFLLVRHIGVTIFSLAGIPVFKGSWHKRLL